MKSIMKRVAAFLPFLPALVLGVSFLAPLVAPTASAVECDTSSLNVASGAACAKGDQTPSSLFGEGGDEGIFKKVVNILLFVIGAVAVIMLIYGGIQYVISGGAQDKVANAKNTILYAVVGIVVAILAFAVVNFVVQGVSDQ